MKPAVVKKRTIEMIDRMLANPADLCMMNKDDIDQLLDERLELMKDRNRERRPEMYGPSAEAAGATA